MSCRCHRRIVSGVQVLSPPRAASCQAPSPWLRDDSVAHRSSGDAHPTAPSESGSPPGGLRGSSAVPGLASPPKQTLKGFGVLKFYSRQPVYPKGLTPSRSGSTEFLHHRSDLGGCPKRPSTNYRKLHNISLAVSPSIRPHGSPKFPSPRHRSYQYRDRCHRLQAMESRSL
jgi:hypothetical protein